MWLGSLAWNELIEIVVSSLSSKYKCKPGVIIFNLNNRKKTLAINLTPSNRLVRRFGTKKARHILHILCIRMHRLQLHCIVYKFMVSSINNHQTLQNQTGDKDGICFYLMQLWWWRYFFISFFLICFQWWWWWWWWWYFDQAGVAVSWAVGAIADITTATNSLPQLLNNDDKDGESLSGQWTWHKLSHF